MFYMGIKPQTLVLLAPCSHQLSDQVFITFLLLLLLWSQVLTEQLFFGCAVFVKQMSLIDTFGSDDDLMDDLDSQWICRCHMTFHWSYLELIFNTLLHFDIDIFICLNFKIKLRCLYLWICLLHRQWSHLNGNSASEHTGVPKTKNILMDRSIHFLKLYFIQITRCVTVISLKQIFQMSHPLPLIPKGWHHFCILYW